MSVPSGLRNESQVLYITKSEELKTRSYTNCPKMPKRLKNFLALPISTATQKINMYVHYLSVLHKEKADAKEQIRTCNIVMGLLLHLSSLIDDCKNRVQQRTKELSKNKEQKTKISKPAISDAEFKAWIECIDFEMSLIGGKLNKLKQN